jgi:hypothetical protein
VEKARLLPKNPLDLSLLARAIQNRLASRALIEDIVRGEIAERSRCPSNDA